jgi:hypothetical protein
MTRSLWVLAVIGSAATLAWSGRSALQARDSARQELGRLAIVQGQAEQIRQLQSAAPAWTDAGKPAAGLTARVGAVLQAAGLPTAALSSLSPEAESLTGSDQVRVHHRRATLTLGGVTLPQTGAFLDAWRQLEPAWTVASVDLGPESNRGNAPAAAGGDLPLRAVIALEAVYVEESGGDR